MASKLPEYNYRSSAKKEESLIYRRIGIVVIATILILVTLFTGGPAFINFMGTFLGNEAADSTPEEGSSRFLADPHLEVLPIATNSALLDIKGYGPAKQTVELTVNDVLVGKLPSHDDGSFLFPAVSLRQDTNQIKVVVTDEGGNQSQAATATITYDRIPPKLDLIIPVNGTVIGAGLNQVQVRGKVDADATVSVNDNQVVLGSDGAFDTSANIIVGENRIKVTATDAGGNQTTIERIVTSQ